MKFIEVKNYKNIIQECFKTDQELLDKWHIESGKGLEKCVERTYKDLMSLEENLKFFSIIYENELIGFFGSEKFYDTKALTSFFIIPKARNKYILNQFWNNINNHFDNDRFLCGIYSKNTRALNFLFKNQGKILIECPDSFILEFNGKEI